MDICQIMIALNLLSIGLADKLNDEDLSLLAALFTMTGDTLAAISLLRARCCAKARDK